MKKKKKSHSMKLLWTSLLALLLWILPLSAEENLKTAPPSPLPVPVKTSLYLWKVENIDEKNETFTAYVYLNFSWQDDRLATQAEPEIFTEEAADAKLKEIWWPEWDFVNSTEATINNRTLTLLPGGKVQYSLKLLATFFTPMDFTRFPFDEQTFHIRVESFLWPADSVQFIIDQEESGFAKDENLDKFDLLSVSTEISTISYIDKDYSEFNFSIQLKRPTKFYLYQILIPIFIIFASTIAMFYIDISDLGSKLLLGQGSILVLVAMKFMINERLPPIDYLTLIDYIFFLSYLSCGVAVAIACIHFRRWQKAAGQADLFNRYAIWIPFILFFIFYLLLFLFLTPR